MDDVFSEYGKELSLMDILEQLGAYCAMNNGNTNEIKIILPKNVLANFNKVAKSKERIRLLGEKDLQPNTIRAVHTTWSGRIELFNADDNEVTMKEKP